MELNILYCSDNNYATYLGISMLSLLKHNTRAERVRIYVVSDAISEENLARLQKTVASFGEGRELIVIDAKEIVEKLSSLGVLTYRGGHAANCRLFYTDFVPAEAKRILYLDCDTLICDDLGELFAWDMKDAPAAWILDSLTERYKQDLGFGATDHYCNSGVILFDIQNWIAANCREKMIELMKDPACRGACPDQDYLNFLLRKTAVILPPRYNFQTTHQIYKDNVYFSVVSGDGYYTKEEIAAARTNPAILHTYRFLGQFPWHKRNFHPANRLFWGYVAESQWADFKPLENHGLFFTLERLLYRFCPKKLFWKAFFNAQNKRFRKQLLELKQQ